MPIIGNGLLAREFSKVSISDEFVIIASGVSDSKENKFEEFLREENLVKEILFKYKEKKIVYFSTCSILQLEITPYISHKIKMEEMIRSAGVQCYIFRLPQVVGVVNNNTLLSYLIKSCYLNDSLKIQENAIRNLLDVEDVVRIVKKIMECNAPCKGVPINIAASSYIRVMDIAEKIKLITQSASSIIVVPGGEKYIIDNSVVKNYIGEKDNIFSDNYALNIIEKYTKKIILEFSLLWDKHN